MIILKLSGEIICLWWWSLGTYKISLKFAKVIANCMTFQFSCLFMSNSLWPHELQHARLPCPSPTPGACSNSCPSSQWCHPNISSSVMPFSSCLQSFPASGSVLHIRWPKYWSFSFSISPSNKYSRLISFRMDWLDLLAVQGTLESSLTPQFKSINSLALSFFNINLFILIGG